MDQGGQRRDQVDAYYRAERSPKLREVRQPHVSLASVAVCDSTFDFLRILHMQQRHGVVRILKIGPPVVRSLAAQRSAKQEC